MFLLFQVQGHLRPSDIVLLSFSGQWRRGILFDPSLLVGFLLDAVSQAVLLRLEQSWESWGWASRLQGARAYACHSLSPLPSCHLDSASPHQYTE